MVHGDDLSDHGIGVNGVERLLAGRLEKKITIGVGMDAWKTGDGDLRITWSRIDAGMDVGVSDGDCD
ncbi:MAG: hypothetical protein ACYSVY_22150 [Planctomycetota bacterium]